MKCKIHADDLKKIVKGTKKFINKYSFGNGQLMQYIKIDVDRAKMQLTATALDCHRISIEKCKIVECDGSFSCLIKPIIPHIDKGLMYADIEIIKFISGETKAYITAGDYIVGFKQPEGTFYDTDKFLNDLTEPIATIGIDAKMLSDAISSISCPGESKDYVKLELRHETEPITIKNKNGDLKVVLPVRIHESWED